MTLEGLTHYFRTFRRSSKGTRSSTMAFSGTCAQAHVLKLLMIAFLPFFAGTSSSGSIRRLSGSRYTYTHVAWHGTPRVDRLTPPLSVGGFEFEDASSAHSPRPHVHTRQQRARCSPRAVAIVSSSATDGPDAPTARSTSASTTVPARRVCLPSRRRTEIPSGRC